MCYAGRMDALDADAVVIAKLVHRIGRLLTGRPAQVQGGVLADLLAIWLAGHIVRGDQAATDALREAVLAMHIDAVRQLVPIEAERIHGK